ncbi:GGDEF domain-containing protein [Leptospira sp. FAT2]|uniref:GGDEF domain-containing protein n=1 Tax=Leptospira sanjuanensis TaxID=2879643 RepID=UPI001EE81DE6|nr:GGDEF domain-containing protein [Leptospira sanjuanensis]MCG6169832.1 GGDEF domain-containing protein [Leptospira sanjuanensis]MCG6195165.1 GGDEF domain-containing protein [Leptospira sanjuanensis]
MDLNQQDEITRLRGLVELYERVSKLSESELLEAEKHLDGSENTAGLARLELIRMSEQLKSIRNIGPDLKTKVISLLHDHESGLKEFKTRIAELSDNNPFFYSDFFRIISHLEIQENDARELWEEIYNHGENMSSSLGRSVNFVVSMLDYIFSKKRIIENPKIVELYSFEEIILNTVIDETSGIYNRRYFNIILNKEINRSARHQRDFCLLIFDVDNFKIINDTYGHGFGDDILRLIAGTMLYSFRQEDICCRIGGEEFAVILPETPKENALVAANRFRNYLLEASMSQYGLAVTVSGGICRFSEDGKDTNELFKNADAALYKAKKTGKDKFLVFSPDL